MVDQLHLGQLLFQQILQVIPLLKHKGWLELIEQVFRQQQEAQPLAILFEARQ